MYLSDYYYDSILDLLTYCVSRCATSELIVIIRAVTMHGISFTSIWENHRELLYNID